LQSERPSPEAEDLRMEWPFQHRAQQLQPASEYIARCFCNPKSWPHFPKKEK